jgi:hypothetical protein
LRPSCSHRPSPAGRAQLRVSFPLEAIIEKRRISYMFIEL